jgi:hypothetical protein
VNLRTFLAKSRKILKIGVKSHASLGQFMESAKSASGRWIF